MLLSLLELASNRVLAFDPDTQQKLERLQGKIIALAIKSPEFTLFFSPTRDGIELNVESTQNNISEHSIKPDVTLKTTLSALIKISRDGLEDADLAPGELDIAGDAITGQRFAGIINNLNIDWEELLAQQIGDSPAHAVSLAQEKVTALFKTAKEDLKQSINHLMQDELQITTKTSDLNAFLDDVDTLRADSDRMKSRIIRLQQTINQIPK